MNGCVKVPKDIDKHIGQRVRHRRKILSMTQTALAVMLGITCQQIQKYENGSNRISAGRLYELSLALQVSVSYFYECLTDYSTDIIHYQLSEEEDRIKDEYLFSPESFELLKVYYAIKNEEVRRNIIQLCHSFVSMSLDNNAVGRSSND